MSFSYGVDLKTLRQTPKLNHFLLPAETAGLVLSQLPFLTGSEPSECGEIPLSSWMITFDEWTVYTDRFSDLSKGNIQSEQKNPL